MIDDEQGDEIEEVRFPELRRDAEIVGAVARRELIAADLDPVLGHQHVGRRLRVDAEPQRRPPDQIGDERHLAAVPGEEPRARSLEALRGRHVWSAFVSNSACRAPFGHVMRTTSAPPASPRPKWTTGEAMICFWTMQSGAKLDLAADAERVDALIAGRGRGARTEDLPSIRLRRLGWTRERAARPAPRPTSSSLPSPSRSAAACTPSASVAGSAVYEPPGRSEQHARGRRAGDDQIGGAVVVEIGGEQARSARLPGPDGSSTRDERRALPRAVGGRARQPRDGAVAAEHEQIEQRVAAAFRRRDRHGRARSSPGSVSARNAPAAKVHEDVDDPGLVQERRVRNAFSVEVGPDEAARARDRGERRRAA